MKYFVFIALLLLLPLFSTNAIELQWDANKETNIVGYRVYVKTGQGVYALVGSTVAATTKITIGLTPGTTYSAVVTAFNADAESTYSNEITFVEPRPRPLAPRGLMVMPPVP